jgi:predicted RNase H-like HicB family nuclease
MTTFQNYITQALSHAEYQYDEETKSWVGIIEELPLCWAQGDTLEEAREELMSTIEEWKAL